jgi:DNA-binding NarL/FixJ family response regulator
MESSVNILVIGRHPQIMETVLRLISTQSEWKAIGALADNEAIEKFNADNFDLVLIGGGVDEESERKLKTEFEKVNPQIKMIRHYGGGSGLLFNEIQEALTRTPVDQWKG